MSFCISTSKRWTRGPLLLFSLNTPLPLLEVVAPVTGGQSVHRGRDTSRWGRALKRTGLSVPLQTAEQLSKLPVTLPTVYMWGR